MFNKRAFRETDRVCERHFDRSQILTHWDHVIEGKLYQLEREKPKIKPSAVPYLNLPDQQTDLIQSAAKRRTGHATEIKKRKVLKIHSENLLKMLLLIAKKNKIVV